MAKPRTNFVCSNCGTSYAKWVGKCDNCGQWNTLVEQTTEEVEAGKSALSKGEFSGKKLETVSIDDIAPSDEKARLLTGFSDLDTVLGGGILLGSVMLLTGQPGIGKSTLLMQICAVISKNYPVLYVSGEESAGQVKMRAERLVLNPRTYVLRVVHPVMILRRQLKAVNSNWS